MKYVNMLSSDSCVISHSDKSDQSAVVECNLSTQIFKHNYDILFLFPLYFLFGAFQVKYCTFYCTTFILQLQLL